MEPKNGGLEDDFPFQFRRFFGSILIFRGVGAGLKMNLYIFVPKLEGRIQFGWWTYCWNGWRLTTNFQIQMFIFFRFQSFVPHLIGAEEHSWAAKMANSLLNDEQMLNCAGVKHLPVNSWDVSEMFLFETSTSWLQGFLASLGQVPPSTEVPGSAGFFCVASSGDLPPRMPSWPRGLIIISVAGNR